MEQSKRETRLSRLHCNCPFFERENWRARTSISREITRKMNQIRRRESYGISTVALWLIQFETAKNISGENISLLVSNIRCNRRRAKISAKISAKASSLCKIPLCNIRESKDVYSREISALVLQTVILNKFQSEYLTLSLKLLPLDENFYKWKSILLAAVSFYMTRNRKGTFIHYLIK